MNRYEKGQIYKIVDVGYNKMYIGSTCETLSKRMERHRTSYKKYLKSGKMETKCNLLFDEYGIENCKILLIEDYPSNSKKELERREGEHQQKNDCVNQVVAGRTRAEHFQASAEEIRAKERQHKREQYSSNPEIFKQRVQQYQENNKDKILQQKKQHYQEKTRNFGKTIASFSLWMWFNLCLE